eukprot:TRINITY_DN2322_c0_g1_i1.p1 TRINITY_DN2322_c0_g1~~TRINITY_DN2322_c0_g1_i1.p1  ORF type:complete len:290 (+),score=113.23 TRINITY_DN2322_c0_g1_i1:28-870(+)
MVKKKGKGNKKKGAAPLPPIEDDGEYDDFIPPSLRAKIEAEEAAENARKEEEEAKKKAAEEAKKAAAEGSSSSGSVEDMLSFGYQVDSSKMKKGQKKIQKQIEDEQEAIRQRRAGGPSQRIYELEKIISFVRPLGLTVKQMPSDGNCMFYAIEDQLRLLHDKQIDAKELRRLTATELRANAADYRPFLPSSQGDSEISDEEFEEYCQTMENTFEWGGNVELQALSRSLALPIRVYSSTGLRIELGDHLIDQHAPLNISFHNHFHTLGAHYNSLVPIVDQE